MPGLTPPIISRRLYHVRIIESCVGFILVDSKIQIGIMIVPSTDLRNLSTDASLLMVLQEITARTHRLFSNLVS